MVEIDGVKQSCIEDVAGTMLSGQQVGLKTTQTSSTWKQVRMSACHTSVNDGKRLRYGLTSKPRRASL